MRNLILVTLLFISLPTFCGESKLLTLDPDYIKSNVEDGATYLSQEERNALTVNSTNGKLYWANDSEVDCQGIANGACQFVMMPDGKIIVSRRYQMITFQHHCLTAEAKEVVVAGFMVVKNGYITSVNDFSVQYVPKDFYSLNKMIEKLKDIGINIDKISKNYSVDHPIK